MSNSAQFGGSFLRWNNPELACLFPAANLRQKSPPSSRRRGGDGGSRLYKLGLGRLFWIPPSCLQIAASNVTSYKTLESFLARAPRCLFPHEKHVRLWVVL